MLNITHHQRNANQNHNEVPSDTSQNGCYQKVYKLRIKAKLNKWDIIKIKSFCTTKEIISKVKRQPSEWEKIIANEATDNLKNIQAPPIAQFQKNKPNQKMGQRT